MLTILANCVFMALPPEKVPDFTEYVTNAYLINKKGEKNKERRRKR